MKSMRYRLLGNSGLKVSELCLGAMTLGENPGWGAGAEESRKIADAFRARGGNFVDTANKYGSGSSEKIVGEIIREDRDAWVVATKFTLSMKDDDPSASGNGRKNMVRAVEKSLRRMGTDYLDLLWVHAWDWTTPVDELMRGLDDLVRAGKILYIGISDAPAWIVSKANTLAELRGWSRFIGLQIEYSLVERTVERELIPMAYYHNIGVLAWAPMAGGVLTGKYTRGHQKDTQREAFNQDRLDERCLSIARAVDSIADSIGASSAQVALRWLMHRAGQIIPIVGSRKLEQIQDCLGVLDMELSSEALAQLDEVSRISLGFPHEFLTRPFIEQMVYGAKPPSMDLKHAVKIVSKTGK